ncbi:MAG: dTDP-4-dehydrorhamnose reductase [Candidatus Meridianibacter frigidus]|nr:MAG: dTDP-4-dehydrorhamnose reductase [Candidatus Eremiobacteraeota bacterium]
MLNRQRILVTGSTGQLGDEVVRAFGGRKVAALSHDDISIEDARAVDQAMEYHRPQLVVNAAAYHNVPACERAPRAALRVNCTGVENLARACAAGGAAFVTVSTDYVFDGTKGSPYTEADSPHPLNAYGRSKLAGEVVARAACAQTYIVRTSGLFGPLGSRTKGYTFIDRILGQAERGERITVVDDMIFSPSYARHVAAALRNVVDAGAPGTYHVVNGGFCSWYEFAREALEQAGLRADLRPISSAAWTDGVLRPPNSSLDAAALRAAKLPELPHWKQAVADYLSQRKAEREVRA